MEKKRFSSEITRVKGRGIIAVPFDANEVWGVKDNHYVTGTVNGCKVRACLELTEGKYSFAVGPVWRRDNRLDFGSDVVVELWPEGPQGETLSADVSKALDTEPEAKAFFEGLATFYRNNFIRGIESAKRPETRVRRIGEMIDLLKAHRREK